MLVAFNRLFFAGSCGCAVLLAGWQETPPGGLAAWLQRGVRAPHWRLSCRFSRFAAPFRAFLRLRDASRGPIVAFSASQGRKRCSGAPWRRFLPRNCCLPGSIRRECFRPAECKPPLRWCVSLLRGRGSSPWWARNAAFAGAVRCALRRFLCRFVANTCGFLVRVHGVR